MDEVTKKTLTITVDQHEAIVEMKRGKDTLYDVVDRLIATSNSLERLENETDNLLWLLCCLEEDIKELKKVMSCPTLK